jgi:nicotinamidase-related amidase/type 1 glutamine amidotransferase
MIPNAMKKLLCFALLAAGWLALSTASAEPLRLLARERAESSKGRGDWKISEKEATLDPAKTAVVICDMWDKHGCKGASELVAEMAPRMHEVITKARQMGLFIIHAPSDTMQHYEGWPQRKLAQMAPPALSPSPLKNWRNLDPAVEDPLPIDDSDGGCDDLPQCKNYRAWSQEIPILKIEPQDAITDSAEAYNLLQQRGIENVIVMGVHANMCVLGRPFSIRQMKSAGKHVYLMRDMTDTMYNSRQKPFVSHFRGTDLVVEHIEKFWCPSITSVAFLGGEPFRFSKDQRKKAVFLIGEPEYHTAETLPDFARKELASHGIDSEFVMMSEKNEFPGFEKIKGADLLFISVRRMTPRKELMALIKEHLAAGKPVMGIRTASHAFDAKPVDDQHTSWSLFDDEILGADYQGHYGNKPPDGPKAVLRLGAGGSNHPILAGIPVDQLKFTSHLYKYQNPAPSVIQLLQGSLEGREEWQPLAWINKPGKSSVFYTSLGSVEDFEQPAFRRLLLNAAEWLLKGG